MLVVLVVSSFTFGFSLCVSSVAATSGNLDGLVITLQSDKLSFILGEPVSLVFRVTN